MDEWKAGLMKKIQDLNNDKLKMQELDNRLAFQNITTSSDRDLFQAVIALIDRDIESLKFELILDDMLESDLPLEEFLKKFNQ